MDGLWNMFTSRLSHALDPERARGSWTVPDPQRKWTEWREAPEPWLQGFHTATEIYNELPWSAVFILREIRHSHIPLFISPRNYPVAHSLDLPRLTFPGTSSQESDVSLVRKELCGAAVASEGAFHMLNPEGRLESAHLRGHCQRKKKHSWIRPPLLRICTNI